MQTPTLALPDLYEAANNGDFGPIVSPQEAKALRERSHLPVSSVAAAVGTSESSILRWESGRAKPRGFAAVRYSRVLSKLAEAGAAR